jgi:hypothetical protein
MEVVAKEASFWEGMAVTGVWTLGFIPYFGDKVSRFCLGQPGSRITTDSNRTTIFLF